jgi:hypothetical protein
MSDFLGGVSITNELGIDRDFIIAVTKARLKDFHRWCGAHDKNPNDRSARDEWMRRMAITE